MSTQGTWTFSEELTAPSQQLLDEVSLEFTDSGPRDEDETDTLPLVALEPAGPVPVEDSAESAFEDDQALDFEAEPARSDSEDASAEVLPTGGGTVVKKPQTAYFLFVAAVRAEVKAAFPEHGLGALQKEIAARWKALSEEDKKVYEDAASSDKARYDAEIAAVLASGGTIATAARPTANVDAGFPISRVRKICKTDPDVKIISKDAVTAMSSLVGVFLEHLARQAGSSAQSHKRKQIKDDDIGYAIHTQRVFDFLRHDFPKPVMSAQKLHPIRQTSKKLNIVPAAAMEEMPVPKQTDIMGFFGQPK